jgi:hypothetical protein
MSTSSTFVLTEPGSSHPFFVVDRYSDKVLARPEHIFKVSRTKRKLDPPKSAQWCIWLHKNFSVSIPDIVESIDPSRRGWNKGKQTHTHDIMVNGEFVGQEFLDPLLPIELCHGDEFQPWIKLWLEEGPDRPGFVCLDDHMKPFDMRKLVTEGSLVPRCAAFFDFEANWHEQKEGYLGHQDIDDSPGVRQIRRACCTDLSAMWERFLWVLLDEYDFYVDPQKKKQRFSPYLLSFSKKLAERCDIKIDDDDSSHQMVSEEDPIRIDDLSGGSVTIGDFRTANQIGSLVYGLRNILGHGDKAGTVKRGGALSVKAIDWEQSRGPKVGNVQVECILRELLKRAKQGRRRFVMNHEELHILYKLMFSIADRLRRTVGSCLASRLEREIWGCRPEAEPEPEAEAEPEPEPDAQQHGTAPAPPLVTHASVDEPARPLFSST